MGTQKPSEHAGTFALRTWKDFPPLNVSLGNMRHNLTGSWRYLKPLYEDKIPACQNACPAGNDIEGWIKLIQKGNIEDAYRHLKREEPFPAVLGRVCFRFCEPACNRAPFDHCVGIQALERYIGDNGSPLGHHPDLSDLHDKTLAVVGSGPAGMSAAYFARMLGFRVTLFEKEAQMGGLLRLGIPAYRLPRNVVNAEFAGLERMGIALRPGVGIGRDISLENLLNDFGYVFLASGNPASLRLRIEGEAQCTRIMSGLELLRRVAAGHPPALGNRVAVVGGGNTAVDAARTAVRLGCEVTVIYRRSEAEMPAHGEDVAQAREEGVRFRFLAAPEKIELAENGTITGLTCIEMQPGDPDPDGRRRPRRKTDTQFAIEADSILTAIGEAPRLEYLAGRVQTAGASLAVDSNLRVSSSAAPAAKIYAGGDIIDMPRTVVHAVAAGKRAAIAMDCDRRGIDFHQVLADIELGDTGALSFSRYRGWRPVNPVHCNIGKVVTRTEMVYDYFQKTPPQEEDILAAADRKTSFVELRGGFDAAQAREEARRCLHCGRCTECDNCLIFCPDMSVLKKENDAFGYRVDFDYCKGCGICCTECPRSAITMVPEEQPLEVPPEEA
jgi:2-oxoacid:acceptor oxidoreductase delta subunit (pyruvate/2-ketoisovalerate family)